MSIRVTGNAIPQISNAALLRRAQWRSVMEHNEVDGSAANLNGQVEGMATLYAAMWRIISGTGPTTFLVERTAWDFSTAAAQNRNICFRPWINALQNWGWRDVFLPLTGAAIPGATPRPPAVSIEGYLRKKAAGDATHARRTFGFGNNIVLSPSAAVPRCGLIGDGALGFRFGSVGCPDGAAAGETAANAIDANGIQPAELVNPGANWFHVRIKLLPAGPGEPGKWAAYLNGRLIKVFDQAANLPRGAGGVAAARVWEGVEPTVYSFSDAGALVGMLAFDVRVTIEDDWTV